MRAWLFPINDSTSLSSSGGSHWSLLLFRRSQLTFDYFDSMGQVPQRSTQHRTAQLSTAQTAIAREAVVAA